MPGPQKSDTTAVPLRAHTSNQFRFILRLPLDRAAPLFGPEGERCWAGPDWDPQFVYPAPGRDTQGAVFTIQRGSHTSIWVNTLFDQELGRMQYVSFVSERMVSVINVRLEEQEQTSTQVHVAYERTALHPEADGDVEALGKADSEGGPRWQEAIERCLAGQP